MNCHVSPTRNALRALQRSSAVKRRGRPVASAAITCGVGNRYHRTCAPQTPVSFQRFPADDAFVNQVAEIAHQENHHPSLQVGFNTCEVHFSTHSCRGLSQNDFICAAKVDRWLLMQEEKIQANKQMKTEHTRYGFVVYVP